MKYLKKFLNHTDYESYITGSTSVLPNVSICKVQKDVHYNPYLDRFKYLTFVALNDSTTFTFNGTNSSNVAMYSLDNGKVWNTINSGASTPSINTNEKILWKGTMNPVNDGNTIGIGNFTSSAPFSVRGNVMSMIYGDNFKNEDNLSGKTSAFANLFKGSKVAYADKLSLPAVTLSESCYYGMFEECVELIAPPLLPSTSLADGCYNQMFYKCSGLTTPPDLPATELEDNCYRWMFSDCPNLSSMPTLNATVMKENCYRGMFSRCTSLEYIKPLPGTIMAPHCYHSMFQGCTDITEVPYLPGTTMADYCYNSMFVDCSGVTTVPQILPATELAIGCYQSMFSRCNGVTVAPELPARELVTDCYKYLFSQSNNVSYVKAMFTTTPSTAYTQSWLNEASATGTFVKNALASWNVRGVHGIPEGWTVETAVDGKEAAILMSKTYIADNPTMHSDWGYKGGLTSRGMLIAYERYQDTDLLNYVEKYYHDNINAQGIINYNKNDYNLDMIQTGYNLFYLKEVDSSTTYKTYYDNVVSILVDQLTDQPRISGGTAHPYYHKAKYNKQVWLDGLYMCEPFKCLYAKNVLTGSQQSAYFNDVVGQLIDTANLTYDSVTQLYKHAYSEDPTVGWIDHNTNGQSYFSWGRALGWYIMAIVDVLEILPTNHSRRNELITILQGLYNAIPNYLDVTSNVLRNLPTEGTTDSRNVLEATSTCMYVYGYLKSVRMGYLPSSRLNDAKHAYESIIKSFVSVSNGKLYLSNCVANGNPGDKSTNRAEVLENYYSKTIATNDKHGVGPFILASVEYDMANQ